jgi:hypothetical protein
MKSLKKVQARDQTEEKYSKGIHSRREGPTYPIKEAVIGPTPDPDRSLVSMKSFLVSQKLGRST